MTFLSFKFLQWIFYNHKKRIKEYSPEDLKAAIEDVKSKTLSSYQAAECYGVPRGTLARHLVNINCNKIGSGRPTRLTREQKESLMIIARTFSEFGFGLNKSEFMQLAEQFIEKCDVSHHFKDGKPGEEWYVSFMNRWKDELSKRTPELLTLTRALSCNRAVVDAWFKLLH